MQRILIVDDNAAVRAGLRHLIERHSEWRVVGEAADGRAAINCVRELHPDLVVLDVVMPEMNGLDAAREMSKAEPRLPILLCSLHLSSYMIEEARKCGARGAVPKSEAGRITEAITALIDHQTFYPSADPA